MENSLEVRVPFSQKKMIEMSFKIDPFLSYYKGNKKEIFKTYYQKSAASKKRGFKEGFFCTFETMNPTKFKK
jgi:asparagine synthase (glutamine-hydrolysing)